MEQDQKQQILNRLKIIEGHIRGVQRMVEEDAYCIDVLNQTRAIQQALAKLDVAERERVLTELLQVFENIHR